MGTGERGGVEPTHDWQLLLPLFGWPEQERYEQICPLVLFDASVAEVGTSASTLYRRLDRFAEDGMESLFEAPKAKRRRLPPAVRRLDMVDEGLVGGQAYSVTVIDNYSRAILSSAVTRRQDLSAFFCERFSRVLDALGYATLRRWRLYAEEGLAGKEADLWLLDRSLTVEHAGEPLSSYEVAYDAAGGRGGNGRLLRVNRPILFETPFALDQMRLFGLAETLGEDGWLKALRLEDYAPRKPPRPVMLQQVLFPYTDAV